MKPIFIPFKPQNLLPARSLYLNLISDKKLIMDDIHSLSQVLQMVLTGDHFIEYTKKPIPVSRATDQAIYERIEELKGYSVPFQTTQLAKYYSPDEMIQAVEGLALQLKNAGVHLIKRGLIIIKNICTLRYNNNGCISKSEPDLGIVGINVLELIAGICAQDFGLVMERHGVLIYFYSSARYEKTPKHVENGFDYFVGEPFIEWHRRIPTWGPVLAALFEDMYMALKQKSLDSFIVDLKGRHQYTNGELILKRYERDYVLPLPTLEGQIIGMIVFADSLFMNINDKLNPLASGKYLHIESPREFHQHFRVIIDAGFRHHPFGIRDKHGISPSSPKT